MRIGALKGLLCGNMLVQIDEILLHACRRRIQGHSVVYCRMRCLRSGANPLESGSRASMFTKRHSSFLLLPTHFPVLLIVDSTLCRCHVPDRDPSHPQRRTQHTHTHKKKLNFVIECNKNAEPQGSS